jgi:short-subunit dehydrogenase
VQDQGGARVALVTGATAGIGREFCDQLAALGHDLIVVSRDAERLEAIAREIEKAHGRSVEVLPADLSSDDEVSRVIEHIASHPIDVLVNNAGFGTKGTIADSPPALQEAMLRVHMVAPMRLTQAALPAMMQRRSGTIINVSSVASFVVSPGNVNYCATKSYLRVFSEALAQEVQRHGIVVQALCPGFTHTEFHARVPVDKTTIPAWAWMSAQSVVRDSLTAARRGRPVVVIPGAGYKLLVAFLRHLPLGIVRNLARRYRRDA